MSGDDRAHDRWVIEAELRSLSTAYATAADHRDGELLSGLFVADGALVVPRYPDDLRPVITRSGSEQLRGVPEGLARYQRTFHQLTNHRYEVAGGLASGEVLCVAHHLSADPVDPADPVGPAESADTGGDRSGGGGPGTDMVWFIRYHDEYRRTDAGWRFVRRELHLQWVEDHPVAVVVAPGPGNTGDGGR
jgi:hypothetical protein